MERKQFRINVQAVLFISYFCLVCAMMGILAGIGELRLHHVAVFAECILICVGIWLCRLKGRRAAVFAGAVFLVFAGYFFVQRKVLHQQWQELLRCLLGMEESTQDVTVLFLGIAWVLAPFCFILQFIFQKGWLVYAVTLPLLFLGPVYGYFPGWGILFLLAVFHTGDGIFHTIYLRRREGKNDPGMNLLTAERGMVFGILLILASFGLACLFPAMPKRKMLRESVETIQDWTDITRELTGQSPSVIPSGKISRGNNFTSGTAQLELVLSRKPKDAIYLKNYTGAQYLGDRWESADESRFFDEMDRTDEEYRFYYQPNLFAYHQFNLVQYGKLRDWRKAVNNAETGHLSKESGSFREWSGMQTLTVRSLTSEKNTEYLPYLSAPFNLEEQEGRGYYLFSWEDYVDYQSREGEDAGDTEDLHLLSSEFYILYNQEWFRQMEVPYQDYAYSEYLHVPVDTLPRLQNLCRENPLDSPEEITRFIRSTLAQNARYSRTPGVMPYREDIAEYFLFEGKEGYCQHFATAAVLMYRMYGIPARYAAGYIAQSGDFSQREDGQYRAVLTDKKAHAWAEIYLGGPGWIPIEVTPPEPVSPGQDDTEAAGQSASGRFAIFGKTPWSERQDRRDDVQFEPTSPDGEEADRNTLGSGEADQTDKDDKSTNQFGSDNTESDTSGGNDVLGDAEENSTEAMDETGAEESRLPGLENLHEWMNNSEETTPQTAAQDKEDAQEHSQEDNARDDNIQSDKTQDDNTWEGILKTALWIVGIFIGAMTVLLGTAIIAVRRRNRRLERMPADELYQRIITLFHQCGCLNEWDGMESDFACAVSRSLYTPDIYSDRDMKKIAGRKMKEFTSHEMKEHTSHEMEKVIGQIQAIAFQSAFGPCLPEEKERRYVLNQYRQICRMMLQKAGWCRKIRIFFLLLR